MNSIAQQTYFQHQTQLNISRAKLCAIIATIIESFLIIRNFYTYGISFHYYVQLYLFLIIISILLYGALHLVEKREDDQRFIVAHRIMFSYYLFTLLWGVTVTLLDQSSYGNVTAYLINLLITATFFITSQKSFYLLHSLPIAILLTGLYIYFNDTPYYGGHVINISIFFVFVVIGTRTIYQYTKQTFEQGNTLNLQNDELNRLNAHLNELANKDALTKTYNRHYLNRYVTKELHKHETIALWIIDIDHFKLYNDFYGHLKGDDALRTVADALQTVAMRHNLKTVRLGGEEFLVLGFDVASDVVPQIAEELRAQVEQQQIPHEKSSTHHVVTISLGFMQTAINTSDSFEKLLEYADEALYKAKQQGRNQVSSVL